MRVEGNKGDGLRLPEGRTCIDLYELLSRCNLGILGDTPSAMRNPTSGDELIRLIFLLALLQSPKKLVPSCTV